LGSPGYARYGYLRGGVGLAGSGYAYSPSYYSYYSPGYYSYGYAGYPWSDYDDYPGYWDYGYVGSAYPSLTNYDVLSYYGYNPTDYSSAYYPTEADGVVEPAAPAPEQSPADDAAHLRVVVAPDAQLWFNGILVPGSGTERAFVSPALTPGKDFTYQIHARWMEDGRPIDRFRTIHVQANTSAEVDMSQPQPGDTPESP
jgi:uncharacterized protein (TIGR03000 family)